MCGCRERRDNRFCLISEVGKGLEIFSLKRGPSITLVNGSYFLIYIYILFPFYVKLFMSSERERERERQGHCLLLGLFGEIRKKRKGFLDSWWEIETGKSLERG